jgi:phospholipid/cholesterol/gamma-HCH transport system ATP-binding protein
VVTYDVTASLKVVDYVYFIADGVLIAEGPTEEVLHSNDPFVHQFVHAEPDGPVAFNLPGKPYAQELGLANSL